MKKIICFAITVFLVAGVFSPSAFAYKPTYKIHAKEALLYNVDTDTVVYSKDADKKIYPASLTKIMVAILYVEHNENLKDLTVTISQNVFDKYQYSDAVIAAFDAGEKVNGYDLLAYTLVKSCADAAAAIAEQVAGSETAFISMMNDKAEELGMDSTHFTNCHGLHDIYHYTTVNDLCKLMKYALRFSVITDMVKMARYETENGITLATTNLLIDPSTDYYYRYATGFKTGYTDEAGRCLISTATYDGMTYFCILTGCPAVENSLVNRYEFIDSAELFRWAFTTFTYRSVLAESKTVDSIPVDYSWDYDAVNVKPDKEIFALMPIDADESTVSVKTIYKDKRVEAPIKGGTNVGKIEVYYAGKKIGEANAVTTRSVEGSQLLRAYSGVVSALDKYKNYIAAAVLAVLIIIIIFIAAVVRLNSKKRKYGKVKNYKRF